MTQSQLRYNEGKSQDSYFWANTNALAKMSTSSAGYVMALECLKTYLAAPAASPIAFNELLHGGVVTALLFYAGRGEGADDALVCAAWLCLFALEDDIEMDGNLGFDFAWMRGATTVSVLMTFETAIEAITEVYAKGAEKYVRGNYRLGAGITQYLDSAFRHLRARLGKSLQKFDEQSGNYHAAHVFWNITQMLEQPAWRDDRLPASVQTPNDPEGKETPKLDFAGALKELEQFSAPLLDQYPTGTPPSFPSMLSDSPVEPDYTDAEKEEAWKLAGLDGSHRFCDVGAFEGARCGWCRDRLAAGRVSLQAQEYAAWMLVAPDHSFDANGSPVDDAAPELLVGRNGFKVGF